MQIILSRVYFKFKIKLSILFSLLISFTNLAAGSDRLNTQTGRYKGYIIKFVQGEATSGVLDKLLITYQDKNLFTMEGVQNIRDGTTLENIEDLNNIDSPLLVVDDYSGGAHCCYNTTILKLHPNFKILAELGGGHSEVKIEKLSKPDNFRVKLDDWIYAYKWTSFAGSPAPEVILHLVEEKISVAREEMKRKPLDIRELNLIIKDINSNNYPGFKYYPLEQQKDEQYISKLLPPVLDLIYSGNTVQAQQLIEQTWPGDKNSKEYFINDLKQTLRMSSYYNDIVEINKPYPILETK